MNKNRLIRYSLKALMWRPLSMGVAVLTTALYFWIFTPGYAGRVLESFVLSAAVTLWVNMFLIPIAVGYEFWWRGHKRKIWNYDEHGGVQE